MVSEIMALGKFDLDAPGGHDGVPLVFRFDSFCIGCRNPYLHTLRMQGLDDYAFAVATGHGAAGTDNSGVTRRGEDRAYSTASTAEAGTQGVGSLTGLGRAPSPGHRDRAYGPAGFEAVRPRYGDGFTSSTRTAVQRAPGLERPGPEI